MIIQTTEEKIRHGERIQYMLGRDSLREKVENHPGALNSLTYRLFKNSVKELETTKALLLRSPQMSSSCQLRLQKRTSMVISPVFSQLGQGDHFLPEEVFDYSIKMGKHINMTFLCFAFSLNLSP